MVTSALRGKSSMRLHMLLILLGLTLSSPMVAQTIAPEVKLAALEKGISTNRMGMAEAWTHLESLHARFSELTSEQRARVFELKAQVLIKANFPVMASIFAVEALKLAPDALHKNEQKNWKLLWRAAKLQPIALMLENLALDLEKKPKTKGEVPEFERDWFYILANAQADQSMTKEALETYKKVKMSDRYFMQSLYQIAMLEHSQKNLDEAILRLQSSMNNATQTLSPLKSDEKLAIVNYARLALARIHYEKGDFANSIKYYRSVDKDSALYYESLFEQSWALFMGGYPGHSLGALYGVNSPFFKDEFNPEAKVLEDIEYYWVCQYNESRNALADFASRHSEEVTGLGVFLNRQRLSSETAYELFENYVTGVSPESLGVAKSVLKAAASKDTMLPIRKEYAALIKERTEFIDRGVFGVAKNQGETLKVAEAWGKSLRRELGGQFLEELKALKDHYEELYAQSQFLYLELLMSQKEQILGRELHGESKIGALSEDLDIKGWGKKTQFWDNQTLNEYWWDEVGFHIVPLKSACLK